MIEESFEDIEAMGLKLFCYDEECDFAPCLVETMSELASSALPVEQTAAAKGVTVKDPVLYIFTSGPSVGSTSASVPFPCFHWTWWWFFFFFLVCPPDFVDGNG